MVLNCEDIIFLLNQQISVPTAITYPLTTFCKMRVMFDNFYSKSSSGLKPFKAWRLNTESEKNDDILFLLSVIRLSSSVNSIMKSDGFCGGTTNGC